MPLLDWKASITDQLPRQTSWLKRTTMILALTLTLALLALQPQPHAAAGQGELQIAGRGAGLEVVISRASSDDPPRHADPGQELDVAECRPRVKQGKLAQIILYNGYPGYTCTLQVTIRNLSDQAVRLQDAQVSAAPGLKVMQINHPGATLVPAGQGRQQVFQIRILEQAAELTQLQFQISIPYKPVDASPSKR